jgi:hypothetical protein
MLFHVPDGASGTFARSIAAGVAVADGIADADAVSAGLAAGEDDGEPLAVTPTQPAATTAVIDMNATHLRQPGPLTNLDSIALPLQRSSISERVCDSIKEALVLATLPRPRMTAAPRVPILIPRRHAR